jgi:hypothetical protein
MALHPSTERQAKPRAIKDYAPPRARLCDGSKLRVMSQQRQILVSRLCQIREGLEKMLGSREVLPTRRMHGSRLPCE